MSYTGTFRVWRGDAAGGDLQDFAVEVNEGEVVLDIIHRLQATQTPDLAVRAAAHYRTLRSRGITIRKTIDVIIATFCIEHGHHLLHDDRDFEHFRPLGLLEA